MEAAYYDSEAIHLFVIGALWRPFCQASKQQVVVATIFVYGKTYLPVSVTVLGK